MFRNEHLDELRALFRAQILMSTEKAKQGDQTLLQRPVFVPLYTLKLCALNTLPIDVIEIRVQMTETLDWRSVSEKRWCVNRMETSSPVTC
jgi:hypothetical protein